MNNSQTFCCPPSVVWAQEDGYALVVDSASGQSWELEGVEADLWTWLACGRTFDQLVSLMACLLPEGANAEATILSVLRGWVERGLVQAEDAASP